MFRDFVRVRGALVLLMIVAFSIVFTRARSVRRAIGSREEVDRASGLSRELRAQCARALDLIVRDRSAASSTSPSSRV